ncbi:hypothetical protein V6O07_15530, partial [Arthrospira platensis SPKY2]
EKEITLREYINRVSVNFAGFRIYLSIDGVKTDNVQDLVSRQTATDKISRWEASSVPYFGVFNTLAQEQAESAYNWVPDFC